MKENLYHHSLEKCKLKPHGNITIHYQNGPSKWRWQILAKMWRNSITAARNTNICQSGKQCNCLLQNKQTIAIWFKKYRNWEMKTWSYEISTMVFMVFWFVKLQSRHQPRWYQTSSGWTDRCGAGHRCTNELCHCWGKLLSTHSVGETRLVFNIFISVCLQYIMLVLLCKFSPYI